MVSGIGRSARRYVADALCLALLAASPFLGPACAAEQKRADFGDELASTSARRLGDWVVDSDDSHGEPFVIVDKVDSRVFVFDAQGRLRGTTAALLGLAKGDASVPGIGSRKMSTIRPDERTTPAGRFVASMEHSLHGDDILWVDYDAAIALHRVVANVPQERRLQRLASDRPDDRRITYGCINVPVKFFDRIVIAAFAQSKGIVYVLPESHSLGEVFGMDGAGERASQPAR